MTYATRTDTSYREDIRFGNVNDAEKRYAAIVDKAM
jgi:hypothetical protein